MSTTTVTLEDLESERADLLPSRETLCGCECEPSCCFSVCLTLCIRL